MKTYNSFSAAKFAREQKEKPSDWVIVPCGRDNFRLVTPRPKKEKSPEKPA